MCLIKLRKVCVDGEFVLEIERHVGPPTNIYITVAGRGDGRCRGFDAQPGAIYRTLNQHTHSHQC